jgi:hypothetical protein
LYALLASVLGLLLLESLLRLAAPSGGLMQGDPEQTMDGSSAIMMHGNPFLLWELAPGDRTEAGGNVHINKNGFRDGDRGAKRRPRAIVLGDSSVYGFGVSDDQVFTTLLEAAVDADIINGGVPGYSTTQALNMLFGRGLALDPDLLIVATLWSDNNFDSFVDSEQLSRYAAWRRTRQASVQGLLERSAIYRTLEFTMKQQQPGRVSWMELRRQTPSGQRRVPIQTYAQHLAEFCTVMAERGGGVVFMVLPNRNDMDHSVTNPPWAPYREVMRRTAKACGAPIVELPEAFATQGQPFLFLDEMHPSPPGHALMAKAIEQTLRSAGWPDKPLQTRAPAQPITPPADPFEGRGAELGLFGGDQQQGR